jgi:hypothetical protein
MRESHHLPADDRQRTSRRSGSARDRAGQPRPQPIAADSDGKAAETACQAAGGCLSARHPASALRARLNHADRGDRGVVVPSDEIGREEALFCVTLAAELLAEVLSVGPDLVPRLLALITEFEKRHGLWASGGVSHD